ncbi:MAG: DNA polymerase III subunit beta [bacterium]|nr:DNA polymerase III subunit beta [bacterium]
MKLIVLKTNLKEGLSAVEKAIGDGSAKLPILKNVLLKAQGNKIKLTTTNLELGIEKIVSAKIIKDGGITIPLSTFHNLVSNSDNEKINLEVKDDNLTFKTDNYEAKIQGIKEEEFPIMPKIDNKDSFIEIKSEIFKEYLNRVVNAAQVSEIRPEISGVLLDFQITLLKLAATDSFRLAEATIIDKYFKSNFKQGFKITIPLKTVQEVLRIFPDDQYIKIGIDPNQILFASDGLELISRLIDGNYPDYDQIIPQDFDTELNIKKDSLVGAIKLVSNFSGKINDIKLRFADDSKNLEIYSANSQLGENNYFIPAKMTGVGFEDVSFNWRYLLDGLKTTNSENVIFGLNGDNRPAIIKSTSDNSYFYILMPIKV